MAERRAEADGGVVAGRGHGVSSHLVSNHCTSHHHPHLRLCCMAGEYSPARRTIRTGSRVAGEYSSAAGKIRKKRYAAGEYSLARCIREEAGAWLGSIPRPLLPAQLILHGWGVLPGRTSRPTAKRYIAGEYSPAGSKDQHAGGAWLGSIPWPDMRIT